jgi:hypothetical protein
MNKFLLENQHKRYSASLPKKYHRQHFHKLPKYLEHDTMFVRLGAGFKMTWQPEFDTK